MGRIQLQEETGVKIEERENCKNGTLWCICPKCGGEHRVRFKELFGAHWAGRGVPRVFCDSCRAIVAYWRDGGNYGLGIDHKVNERQLRTEDE